MRKIILASASTLLLLAAGGCAQMGDMFGGEQASRPISEQSLVSVAQLEPAEMLGKSVLAYDGQSVGEVEDVLMGRSGNRASHLVVSSGGVMGLGGRSVALDIDNVRYARDRDAIVATQLTREQFASLPEYQGTGNMVSLNRSRGMMSQ